MYRNLNETARQGTDLQAIVDRNPGENPAIQSGNARRFGALRPTATAALIAVLSVTAACGSGDGGGATESGNGGAVGSASASTTDISSNDFMNAPTDGSSAYASTVGTTEPAVTPTSTAIPSGTAFSCAFETTFSDCRFIEQAKVPGRATMVTVAGVKAVRLHTEPGDNNVAGSGSSERNDLTTSQATTDGYEGREHWWAHSILFPDDYVDPPISTTTSWNFGALGGFHNTTNGAGQGNLTLLAMPTAAISPDRPTGLSFKIAWGSQTSPTEVTYPIGPVVRNQWYNFVYHVKWSSGSDGYFDAWVNGVKKMSYRGPTLYPGQGVYLKLANYHTAFGQPSSVIHARVIRSNTALDVNAGL